MLINGKEVNLDAPAFGDGAQQMEEVSEETTQETESNEEVMEEEASESEEEVVEESKVPYSRFKKFHDEAKTAKEEAEYWKQEAMRRNEGQTESTVSDVPDYWVRLYGDSDESKEAWKIQRQINEETKMAAIEAAKESLRSEQLEEARRTQENIETIDDGIELLSASLGRELTEKEQSDLLDIVDEYTPKDDDGNYLGAIMSFDKAWEILDLKKQANNGPRKQSRDTVAAITGSRSQGKTEISDKENSFVPGNWFGFEKRL